MNLNQIVSINFFLHLSFCWVFKIKSTSDQSLSWFIREITLIFLVDDESSETLKYIGQSHTAPINIIIFHLFAAGFWNPRFYTISSCNAQLLKLVIQSNKIHGKQKKQEKISSDEEKQTHRFIEIEIILTYGELCAKPSFNVL